MTNVVHFYDMYNFVANYMKDRLRMMHVTPEHTTIPSIVKDGKILSDDDLLIYDIMYHTAETYFAQDMNMKTGNYFEHFVETNNIKLPDNIPNLGKIKEAYGDFIGNRYCLDMMNCYSNQDKEFEVYNPWRY
jgi:hypothetical protein